MLNSSQIFQIFEKNYNSNKNEIKALIDSVLNLLGGKLTEEKTYIFNITLNHIQYTLKILFTNDLKKDNYDAIIFYQYKDKKLSNRFNGVIIINKKNLRTKKERFFAIMHEFAHFFILSTCEKKQLTQMLNIQSYVESIKKIENKNLLKIYFGYSLDKNNDIELPICSITREMIFDINKIIKFISINKSLNDISDYFQTPQKEVRLFILAHKQEILTQSNKS